MVLLVLSLSMSSLVLLSPFLDFLFEAEGREVAAAAAIAGVLEDTAMRAQSEIVGTAVVLAPRDRGGDDGHEGGRVMRQ